MRLWIVKRVPRPGNIHYSFGVFGVEPGTFRSSVWRSPNWAISAARVGLLVCPFLMHSLSSVLMWTFCQSKAIGHLHDGLLLRARAERLAKMPSNSNFVFSLGNKETVTKISHTRGHWQHSDLGSMSRRHHTNGLLWDRSIGVYTIN